jgi:diguanylate cyclase (GGDEF)-like protein
MGDVNGLKATNDQDGHEAGDALIRECARAVSKALHIVPGGLAGRIGGDEFCIVLDGYGLARAESFAAEILRLIAQGPRPRSLAVGVASTESPGASTAEPVTSRRLMRWADEAQYAAKRQGSATAMVAGRDVPLAEPVERRRRRRDSTAPPGAAERAAVALDAALRTLAEPDAPHEPLDRLLSALDAVVDAIGGSGWVVGARDTHQVSTVAFAAGRDGLAVDAVIPLVGAGWAEAAAAAGVLSAAGDSSIPLASLRGCGSVAAASAGAWWVEVLADPPSTLDGVPAVLRSLVCVAVAG